MNNATPSNDDTLWDEQTMILLETLEEKRNQLGREVESLQKTLLAAFEYIGVLETQNAALWRRLFEREHKDGGPQ